MRSSLTLSLTIAISISSTACRRPEPTRPIPVSTAAVGQCADPASAGVIGKSPRLQRADRDLDGDGRAEVVVADRGMCTGEGNCYWNIYRKDDEGSCHRYLGTVAGAVIDRLVRRGEDGFHDLRAWWRLTSDSRFLLQEYRYRHGGYRMAEAMVCRQGEDDRLDCATDT